MKKYTFSLLAAMIFATSAMAFDLPTKIDPKETKFKVCVTQEAKDAIAEGELTKENLQSEAKRIAATCAAKAALKSNSVYVDMAVSVIGGLL